MMKKAVMSYVNAPYNDFPVNTFLRNKFSLRIISQSELLWKSSATENL